LPFYKGQPQGIASTQKNDTAAIRAILHGLNRYLNAVLITLEIWLYDHYD